MTYYISCAVAMSRARSEAFCDTAPHHELLVTAQSLEHYAEHPDYSHSSEELGELASNIRFLLTT